MAPTHNILEYVDKDIFCLISSWLDVEDINRLSMTSRALKTLLNTKSIWTLQLKNYLPVPDLIIDQLPKLQPKELFIFYYTKFKKLRNYLSNIIRKVNPTCNAERLLESNYKYDFYTRKELEEIISDNYYKIPADYYMLFRLLNGQNMLCNKFPDDVCFFGGYSFNQKYYEFEYLPLSQPEFPFLQRLKFHTLAIDREKGVRYYVDFHNILECGHGAIFSFLNQRNESGSLIFRTFVYKKSIEQFLAELQVCKYSKSRNLIDRFDTLYNPQSDTTTDGIRVRVSSIFNPWEMNASGFLFAYQIRVSVEGLKGKWRLGYRHLIITDGYKQEEVEGMELNGKLYEIMDKGEDLLYESWIYTQNLATNMKGCLIFVNTETKQEIRAQIGDTSMEFPAGCCLLDLNQKDLSIKVLIDNTS